MFSRFFIDRPIFAAVLSIVITLGGGIALVTLPITQYPEITPPTVEVSAVYPGANAIVVADTVAAPIEQQVNGVEDMMYMSSQCTNDGAYTLTVTFRPDTNLNLAQVLVQNRVNLAEPILPDLVKRRGIMVKKKSPTTLMIVNLFSSDDSRDNLYLSNYATIQLRDELARLPGVGDITFLGERDYSMRVWLDPERMSVRKLSAGDVVTAIEQQNAQVAAGRIGQPPVPGTQVFQFTMNTLGRLTDSEQFGDMVLKSDTDGRIIRLRDVGRVELGAQAYDQVCTLDGRPSVALSIYQLPGSNALQVAELVKSRMRELKNRFPAGLDYQIVYDTTPFIRESVIEVFRALGDAVLLVAVVVLVFLQGWRAAVIPLIAVPVAIVGTFAAMAALGFSLNNLTLFGLVLAIGIVVDDAIVVVEAVEHHVEKGKNPRDAAIQAMNDVSAPVIAVGLVLTAVFVPCAFITGIVGQFFRQFALTIAISTLISAFNSLTLSPALAVLLLKPKHDQPTEPLPRIAFPLAGGWLGFHYLSTQVLQQVSLHKIALSAAGSYAIIAGCVLAGIVVGWLTERWLNRGLAWCFRAFNRGFAWATAGYVAAVGRSLRASLVVLAVYGGLLYFTGRLFAETPTGFIPSQDKGYLLVNVQLPDSSPLERTEQIMQRAERVALGTGGVSHTLSIAGQSILLGANAPNFGTMYVMLDDFEHRLGPGLSAEELAERLRGALESQIKEGIVNIFGAPPVDGLGTAGGFKLMIEDRGGSSGLKAIEGAAEKIVGEAKSTSELRDLFTSFRAETPWLNVDIDRREAKTMGVSVGDVFSALQVYFGSYYVNDINRFGRTWQVNVQADTTFRDRVEDLKRLKIPNVRGDMVPLSAIAGFRETTGPVMVVSYNPYPAAAVQGMPNYGYSSGQAIARMEELAGSNLPQLMRYEWTELALLQLQAGNTATIAFILAVMFVFLVLAAQYESWSLPLAVILVVPMCLLCAVGAVALVGRDINIFTQIGLVVLVGLACKNAILIVEFAQARCEAGIDRYNATLDACLLRLRPIMMTSFAFILGVVPLVVARGAGAEMHRSLGTAVFGGMLGVTLFGIFLTPVFFYVIHWIGDWRKRGTETPPVETASDV